MPRLAKLWDTFWSKSFDVFNPIRKDQVDLLFNIIIDL